MNIVKRLLMIVLFVIQIIIIPVELLFYLLRLVVLGKELPNYPLLINVIKKLL